MASAFTYYINEGFFKSPHPIAVVTWPSSWQASSVRNGKQQEGNAFHLTPPPPKKKKGGRGRKNLRLDQCQIEVVLGNVRPLVSTMCA